MRHKKRVAQIERSANLCCRVLCFVVVAGLTSCSGDGDADSKVNLSPQSESNSAAAKNNELSHAKGPITRESFKELAPEKQKEIWKAEHVTFEIETKFGKPFADALKRRDRKAVRRFFRDDFQCRFSLTANFKRVEGNWWWQTRLDSESPSQQGGVDRFVDRWLEYVGGWKSIDLVRLRVLAIDAPENATSDAWSVKFSLSAKGISESGPTALGSEHQVVCRFADDEDIAAGEILMRWKEESVVVSGSKHFLMREVTKQAGLDQVSLPDNWTLPTEEFRPYTKQIAVADYDNDGFLDIAIAVVHRKHWAINQLSRTLSVRVTNHLLKGDGKRFREVTKAVGLPEYHNQAAWLATFIDFDNDGFQDLLLGSSLYRNINGQRFEDVTRQSGLRFDDVPMGCVVADYDVDGRLDMYVVKHSDPFRDPAASYVDDNESGVPNRLWKNLGNGKFRNVAKEAGVQAGRRQSFAASWMFANDDNFPDLYVVNDFARNQLFINDGKGSFSESGDEAGVAAFAASMGVATGDVTGDGNTDILVSNMFSKMGRRIINFVGAEDYPRGTYEQIQGACRGNLLFSRKPGSHKYEDQATELGVAQAGWAHAPVLADFDNDGQLDMYVTCGFRSVSRKKPDG